MALALNRVQAHVLGRVRRLWRAKGRHKTRRWMELQGSNSSIEAVDERIARFLDPRKGFDRRAGVLTFVLRTEQLHQGQ